MGQSRMRAYRTGLVVALLFGGTLAWVSPGPAVAQVSAVKGSAFGYALNVGLFGGPPSVQGPAPTVTLPSGGSASPVTGTAPSAVAEISPAAFFSSGQIDVSTQGTPAGGSVTSSARITNLNTSQAEILTASAISSTCTANANGVTGSTTVTGGVLQTDSGNDQGTQQHPATTVPVPANPAPNTVIEGHVHVGNSVDTFRVVFNEQIRNDDGSLTVNAAHEYFLGNIARGDLIIGQSVCGLTGQAVTTTTSPGATTTAPGATTTTAPGATTSTAPATTTTAAQVTTTAPTTTTTAPANTTTTAGPATAVGGGAYGYFVSVSLFGGPAASRGPAPTVTLPAAGSATPVTDTAASGMGQFGPATIFSSGKLDVSTQGTPGGSVTSSANIANVNASGQEVLTAATAASTCTASATGATGSATFTGAKLRTSEGNPDVDGDDTEVTIPANPAPNTSFTGKIEAVGDTFRMVLNEQVTSADGSITVNAAHMYLLGPVAVGELVIGQSRCGVTTASGSGSGGGGSGGTQTAAGSGSALATSGGPFAVFVAMALMLLVGGCTTTYWVAGVRWSQGGFRRMPWEARSFLR